MISSMLAAWLWAVLFLTCSDASPLDALNVHQLSPRVETREVYMIVETREWAAYILPDGTQTAFVHSQVWVKNAGSEGSIRVEFGLDVDDSITQPSEKGFFLRIQEYPATQDYSPTLGDRSLVRVGTTTLSNKELFDFDRASGAIAEVFGDNWEYRIGPGNANLADPNLGINDCNTFVRNLVAKLGGTIPPEWMNRFRLAEMWQAHNPSAVSVKAPIRTISYNYKRTPTSENFRQRILRADSPPPCYRPGRGQIKRQACTDFDERDPTKTSDDLAKNPNYKDYPQSEIGGENDYYDSKGAQPPAEVKSNTFMARANGKLQTFTSFLKSDLVIVGAGAALTVLGAAFVIAEFIEGQWKGGIIGAVGLGAGLAAGFALSGPVGWILGIAIAVIFAILPGVFEKPKPPPLLTDKNGILQWKMFGDASHTGNEQCQQGTADVPGNKDCQALYGPGAMAMSLGMKNSDAVVFQIHFNNGFPMTIPDMAKNFYVKDPLKKDDGGDQIATVDCNNKKSQPAGKAGAFPGDDMKKCNHPTFAVNPKLVTLPNLNVQADTVYDKLTPKSGATCKLVVYPGTTDYDDLGFSVSGKPSAITCDLDDKEGTDLGGDGRGNSDPNAGENGGGDDGGNGDGGNDSATGPSGDAFVQPPPATPFADLDRNQFACISYKDHPLCLPRGTYKKQSGKGFEIRQADTIQLPNGGGNGFNMTVTWTIPGTGHWGVGLSPGEHSTTYTENQNPPKSGRYDFRTDMEAMDNDFEGKAHFEFGGPDDGTQPICCLYSEPEFKGLVICLGEGGGDLPDAWKDSAQSLKCWNGANAYMFTGGYGDKGESPPQSEIADLKEQVDGDMNFSKRVKAVWIKK